MASTAVEKTEEELRKEIDELHRHQREITVRLRDPRGLRRGGLACNGPRTFVPNGARPRGFVRPADRIDSNDQPPPKRRLSSAIVKMDVEDIGEPAHSIQDDDKRAVILQQSSWSWGDNNKNMTKDFDTPATEHVPRIIPKDEDPKIVSRNKRMLGQLLGTLEKFRKEDVQFSETQNYMRRSFSLQRAEQRAREESEKLRLQERERIAEKRRRDLMLRARIAAKVEEKKLELLFLGWSEHHKKLCNFQRTKAEPPIYYSVNRSLDESMDKKRKEQEFQEWKISRREELCEYEKQMGEQYICNVEKEFERWQNARKARKTNNETLNLQESMDRELESHRSENGRKKNKIINGEDEEDNEDDDINVGDDEDMIMMDDVAGMDESTKNGDSGISNSESHLL